MGVETSYWFADFNDMHRAIEEASAVLQASGYEVKGAYNPILQANEYGILDKTQQIVGTLIAKNDVDPQTNAVSGGTLTFESSHTQALKMKNTVESAAFAHHAQEPTAALRYQ